MSKNTPIQDNEAILFDNISKLIEESKKQVAKAVNTAMVYTYYGVGNYIVQFEQEGKDRAKYGKEVLKRLSDKLTERHGKGWSVETLTKSRKFFIAYSNFVYSVDEIQNPDHTIEEIHQFKLPWSHYQILMRIDNLAERNFYEIEAYNSNWSVRQLQREYNSSLYERLALSRDKEGVMKLSEQGHTVDKPMDILKNPLVLDFLGLKSESAYSESKLETAIISKLQDFLLEMGKGFLFEARQKRFTFDEDNFYVDLVLYNRILQCYVLVDLKVDKLTHQDLGQMQMYVNYYDRYVKLDFEKPTIGILLCKQKNDALVELTLPKDANIYSQQYATCLPEKSLLQQKVMEWAKEYEEYNY